jgi:hypothetical protein
MKYLKKINRDHEFYAEIFRDTFRTRIVFDFMPDENFKGFAVGCNYSFCGNPIGYLKDNGKSLTNVTGKRKTSVFEIEDTVIQAGPTLVDCFEKMINWRKEGFISHDVLRGFHPHIGKKKTGNIILGYTTTKTPLSIAKQYMKFTVLSAIKLPGLRKGSFYFKSSHQEIKIGLFPIPVALIIEPKLESKTSLDKLGQFLS